MKNTITKVLGALAVAAALLVPTRAWAVNQGDAVLVQADATANVGFVVGQSSVNVSSSMAVNLTYIGASSAAYVTISTGASSGFITFYAPFNVVDTGIGSATAGQTGGTFDLAPSTSNTMGQLCDLINASTNYRCTLLGTIRSDLASQLLPAVTAVSGVNALNSVGGYNVSIGTQTVMSLGIIPAPNRRVVLFQCNVNSTGTTVNLQVFGRKRQYGGGVDPYGSAVTDSYLAFSSQQLTQSTVTNFPNSTALIPWIEFTTNQGYSYKAPPTGTAYNGKVVVRASNYGTNSLQTNLNYIQCLWQEK